MEDLGDLAELGLLAVLATYRRDGTVLLSPVWHEWREGGFSVVTSSRDVKAVHLRRDPRASIVVCSRFPPCRGIEVRCHARFVTTGVRGCGAADRLSLPLAERPEPRTRSTTGDDLLIRLEPGDLRAWDFAGELS